MRALLPGLLAILLAHAGAAVAEDAAMVTLETADDSRGWDAVGKLALGDHGFCTGALIAPQLVLTAAHCLYDKETGVQLRPEDIEFQAGFRNGRALAYRSVIRAVAHPDYRYSASLLDNGSTIFLNITGFTARQWNGLASGTANGTWNVGTTANWLIPPSTATTFTNGDAAVFNDAAAGTTSVVVAATVSPSSVTIDNSTLAYDFTGTGAISGTASLVKQGSGAATIATANSYTGATTIAGGQLAVATLAPQLRSPPVDARHNSVAPLNDAAR